MNGEIEAPILIIDKIISDLERVLKITKSLYLTYIHLGRIPYQRFSIITFKMVF
jgi:hypothetical protein